MNIRVKSLLESLKEIIRKRSAMRKFVNAYPISINQMPVSYDASQILLCTVNFNFSRYIISGER